jgi:hypothetical protein
MPPNHSARQRDSCCRAPVRALSVRTSHRSSLDDARRTSGEGAGKTHYCDRIAQTRATATTTAISERLPGQTATATDAERGISGAIARAKAHGVRRDPVQLTTDTAGVNNFKIKIITRDALAGRLPDGRVPLTPKTAERRNVDPWMHRPPMSLPENGLHGLAGLKPQAIG